MSEILFSEVLKDNDNSRIDSEYFKKEFLNFFKNIPNLRNLSEFVLDGYRVVYENTKIIDSEVAQEKDCPIFLQATDLATPFIRADNFSYVDNQDWERYVKGRIKSGEILIEVKGKVEKVAIVPNDFPDKTLVSGSLYKMTVNEKISKYVLLTYLISKYGTAFKNRYKTNLLISFISKPDLYRIPVPNFSSELQNKIDSMFINIFKSQKQSEILYKEAETLLLEHLGLKDFQAACKPVNIKSLKDSFLQTGRLDAEYYQPIYELLKNHIFSHSNGFAKLGDVCRLNDENYTPKDNQEYDYIELSNIGKSGEITGSTRALGKELPSRARRKVQANQVMISSIEGSLQSCAIVPAHYDNALCSTGFYVLSSDKINAETLLVLFKSSLMQQILKKNCSGTILTAINKEELLNIPLPIIDEKIQTQIAEFLRQSNDLREQATQLLAQAKSNVELEIENISLNINNLQDCGGGKSC
ncbi:restriction endonuclease subunit S [Alysiella filiformis]|uniref:restriction endonuclease subunit S n=2 Tax=Alysiella filiformis TaxID=194196 RepID=UPI0015F60E89|nr:restriction endonuclease subunit S [Alysiella filiformis]QMT32232.1 restriction endonuclease subunit S [Alysiella filiformis]